MKQALIFQSPYNAFLRKSAIIDLFVIPVHPVPGCPETVRSGTDIFALASSLSFKIVKNNGMVRPYGPGIRRKCYIQINLKMAIYNAGEYGYYFYPYYCIFLMYRNNARQKIQIMFVVLNRYGCDNR
jgi:hypothetical protein